VADAETWFEFELPGQLSWRFGEAEARHLCVVGGHGHVVGEQAVFC
jgi:hypothetical protein